MRLGRPRPSQPCTQGAPTPGPAMHTGGGAGDEARAPMPGPAMHSVHA